MCSMRCSFVESRFLSKQGCILPLFLECWQQIKEGFFLMIFRARRRTAASAIAFILLINTVREALEISKTTNNFKGEVS